MVAFSGGADSTALLCLTRRYVEARSIELSCIHVDHGLSVDSANWAKHCAGVARELQTDYRLVKLNSSPGPGESVEAWAREARYRAMQADLDIGDALLTAHHADDQAETLLMRLFSGAGPHGLAAIVPFSKFGRACLYRPLLDWRRSELEDVVRRAEIECVEDPMNRDTRFLRAQMRHELLPEIIQRYPQAVVNLGRSARIQREVADYLDDRCNDILKLENLPDGQLRISTLRQMSVLMQKMLIRALALGNGLDVPGERHLEQVMLQLCGEQYAATACVKWGENQLRRYRDVIYALRGGQQQADLREYRIDPGTPVNSGCGLAELVEHQGPGLDPQSVGDVPMTIRFRRGGESCRPHGRGGTHKLKKLFQEWGVPPWERVSAPLLYVGEEIAAVGNFCLCDPFASSDGKNWQLRWTPHQN